MNDNTMQTDPNPQQRLQIGSCEWVNCGRPAYYEVSFDCDDINAQLCSNHHTSLLNLLRPWVPGFADCESDE
jgi:hypothetical protein